MLDSLDSCIAIYQTLQKGRNQKTAILVNISQLEKYFVVINRF